VTFDLEQRRAEMSVGDLSDFSIGPRGSLGGTGGLWRAQLGSRWHREIREQAEAEGADAAYEVAVAGELARKGWRISLAGRIDQVVQAGTVSVLREIKTVTRDLPAAEPDLRRDYPEYFVQLAAYAALRGARERCELVFVEADTGLAQTVGLSADDSRLLDSQLDRVAEFLDLRLRARERLRQMRYRPAFASLRPGQETAAAQLRQSVREAQSAVLLEAPTGFGKTGILLDCALGELREGHFDRVLYLTGKSTGQLEVVATLAAMTGPGADLGDGPAVAAWHVRNKSEHCVNTVFQCLREACAFLDRAEERWPGSGLSRFYLLENQPRDLTTLRTAGLGARICPYEITRAALAFNDVWIGDFNYVFSPESRVLFYQRPGFDPARTLLVVDEAHNLPSRVADAYSHAFSAADADAVCEALLGARADGRWRSTWEGWAHFLQALPKSGGLPEGEEEAARDHLARLAEATNAFPVDPLELGPHAAGLIWGASAAAHQLASVELPRLWWAPDDGTLSVTCLDAAPAIGAATAEFGGVVYATATPGPAERFAEACGGGALRPIRAATPWRDGAYDVAVDLRVDTTFQQRQRHAATTAETVWALHRSAGGGAPIAVFFPSYAYAEAVAREFGPAALQPRRSELAAQNAWLEDSLDQGRALFLVLGSGFAEGIDLLGGRVAHAMVVGPALPEMNPVQRAKLAAFAELGREAAFDRVYRIPGMQKVNQALGRLVRAPGQSARVLLHCRRFGEPGYARLLAPEYQDGRSIRDESDLAAWLERAE
jgi:DNA excision repair protein ERCC-2